MGIVHERYRQLQPSIALLADPVVLAQAWKKAESYVRRHNSYADLLELDCSVVNAERLIETWAGQLKKGVYRPEKMKSVLAPKHCVWSFDKDGWSPKERPNLRHLAHLSIRDQSVALAAVLCLADAVETVQGSTKQPDVATAQERQIFSYGNRLHCEWQEVPGKPIRARFGWGNVNTYSKYFLDYQRFLKRPGNACEHFSVSLASGRALFVLKLDLKSFFDRIYRPEVIVRLRKIWNLYSTQYGITASFDEEGFWAALQPLMDWQWSEKGHHPMGLPQGLVASGFFANAYLFEFDNLVAGLLHQGEEVVLRDYCRYVDDIRLVLEAPAGTSISELKQQAKQRLDPLLKRVSPTRKKDFLLQLNEEKTEIVPFSDFPLQGRASEQMAMLQGALSGTPDVEELRQLTSGLSNLLWLSEQFEPKEFQDHGLALGQMARSNSDVRDDTIKRFVAHRLSKALRLRRSMADETKIFPAGEFALEEVSESDVLNHEFETTARKLVACWSKNPSLVVLLRVGLDLFPSPRLLRPVLEALENKFNGSSNEERNVVLFVLADLLKAGVSETGHRGAHEYPAGCDIAGYRIELERLAVRLIEDDQTAWPWFLLQQAYMFLASVGRAVEVPNKAELHLYRLLHRSLRYLKPKESDRNEMIRVSLIAQQLAPNQDRYALWLYQVLEGTPASSIEELIEMVGQAQPQLLAAAIGIARESGSNWLDVVPSALLPEYVGRHSSVRSGFKARKVNLAKLVRRDFNPFSQENALLLLTRALLEKIKDGEDITTLHIADVQVVCRDWSKIQNPGTQLQLELKKQRVGPSDRRIETPGWCKPEMSWAYALGRLLRSCITGEPDYTNRTFTMLDDHARYRGLRSSWFKRRIGMIQTGAGLNEEPLPVSPWLSELIMRLLQWPGLEIHGSLLDSFDRVQTPAELDALVLRRIEEQKQVYGRLSSLPMYVLPADIASRQEERGLRVAVVQTLLPRKGDFDDKDLANWTPAFRRRHRAHLASVCRLVYQHLRVHRTAQLESSVNPSSADTLDLIVFPELSIHPSDLFLIRQLSDATMANIFAGLTFQPNGPGGALVNQAVWLLRHVTAQGRSIVPIHQGKQHLTPEERKAGVVSWRPYQLLIRFKNSNGGDHLITGAICYDATDLALAADLRDTTDALIVTALNKDITTFDNMASALNYHMYQPVVISNSGEFGGSTAQAPYRQRYDQLIAHIHGTEQVAVSVFWLDLEDFHRMNIPLLAKEKKSVPAGYVGRCSPV